MLDLKVLAPPLKPAAEELDISDGRFEYIANMVLKGHYDDAATRSKELIEEGYCDIRVICYFLLGVFRQDGVTGLPRLCGVVTELITTQLNLLSPFVKREREIDRSLAWLFSMINSRLSMAAKEAGESWQRWVNTTPVATFDQARLEAERLAARLRQINPRSQAAQGVDVLSQWLANTSITSPQKSGDSPSAPAAPPQTNQQEVAVPTVPKTQARQQAVHAEDEEDSVPDEEQDEDHDDDEDDDDDEPEVPGSEDPDLDNEWDDDEEEAVPPAHQKGGRLPPSRRSSSAAPKVTRSAATLSSTSPPAEYLNVRVSWHLRELLRKVALLQHMAEQGDPLRASIVARDIESKLSSFDPRIYFPDLFVNYYKVLSASGVSQELSREATHPTVLASLEQLYRMDEASFCSAETEQEE